MAEIEIKTKMKIVILGMALSLLFLLMIWSFYARMIKDYALDILMDNEILALIIMGLLGITFIVSIGVGIMLTEDLKKKVVFKASYVSLLIVFIFILGLSYGFLFLLYPEVFSQIKGIEILLVFPSVIVYFSLYVLNNVFSIFIISILLYFIIFILLLEKFYEYKNQSHDVKYKELVKKLENRRY